MQNSSKIASFKKTIRSYYRTHKRDFPWRQTHDPYAILVSEIMLQQTQTDRVITKYHEWLKVFPTWQTLSEAPLQDVLKVWKGLGYNRRALALKRTATEVISKYHGKLPKNYEMIVRLPGIGPYTAGAVMAFAFNTAIPIIETNIRTVYIHFFFKDHGQVHDKEILELVEKTLPKMSGTDAVRDWYYALMDYGVMLKKTVGNLNHRSKHYTKQSKFEGSHRQLRAKILHLITATPLSEKKIIATLELDPKKVSTILSELEQEGFIKKENSVYSIV